MRAIVTGEEDDRLAIDAGLTQFGKDLPDVLIHASDHRGKGSPGSILRAIADRGTPHTGRLGRGNGVGLLIPEGGRLGKLATKGGERVLRDAQFSVGHREGEVEEEGFRFSLLDEIEGAAGEEVVDVVLLRVDRKDLAVLPEMAGVLAMGVGMIEESERLLKALEVGTTGGRGRSQPPFAEETGAIASRLEPFGDRLLLWEKWMIPIATDAKVAGVLPEHERRPRRGADGASRIVAGEPDSLGRHAVEVRSLEAPLAVDTEVAIAKIIRVDEDEVGARGGSADGRPSLPV